MDLNQHFIRLFSPKFDTVASRGVGTRSRPTSPLHSGVSDPEQILKTTRKVRRSQSLPALCDPDQLGDILLGKEEENSEGLNIYQPCVTLISWVAYHIQFC